MIVIRSPRAGCALLWLCALALSACGGGGGGGDSSTPTYTVRGTVSGLSGAGLVLRNNGGDDLNVSGGSFQFATALASGSTYNVTVRTQPASPSQTCSVTNGSGTISGANVTNVQVNCTTNSYFVGGTVTGLTGSGLVLQLNGGNNVAITSANRNFTFPAAILSGNGYSVSVLTQPSAPVQTCTVTNGSGTMGGVNVANVIVSCVTSSSSNSYTVGGRVDGLTGAGLQLQLNSGSTLSPGPGAFAFPAVADGTAYGVAVSAQPSGQTCTIANPSGTVAGANVTNVIVTCATGTYAVGGTTSGLAGTGLKLQLNGGDIQGISGNGGFSLGAIADGSAYSVTVHTQPSSPSQTCAVTNDSGTVSGADVTDVGVTCTTNSFPVSVTVSGLSGSGLVLQNNSTDNLSVGANGSFTFATQVASGAVYGVTVATQPSAPAQTCTVANGSGTVGNGSVTNIGVTCAVNTYTVGGSVTGLTGAGLALRLNGGSNLPVSGSSFTFPAIADGSVYEVTVGTQPALQTCTVANGAGTLAGADVGNVTISCSALTWSSVKQFGSTADDVANAVAVAANGDVVVVGCYQGALTGTHKNTCDMPGGNSRLYVRKYDLTGAFRWEASLGNAANIQANAVTIDGSGDIYIAGISQNNFDGQPGINSDDAFLTKYSSGGTRLWTRVFGTPNADRANTVVVSGGGVYVAGTRFVSGTPDHYDAFVTRFDTSGTEDWTALLASTSAGPAPDDAAMGLAADGSGYLYVSGTTTGNMGGNTNAGGVDVFVAKLDPAASGAAVWTQQIGTSDEDRNAGVAVNGSSVYVGGHTGGVLAGSTSRLRDLFVAKYDTSGNADASWPQQLASHLHDFATGIAVAANGEVYVTGYTNGNFDVNTNADPSTGTNDMFLAKYNAGGVLQWTREYGTTTDDRAYAIATSGNDAFVVGYTLGALGGNANAGGADMFVVNYDSSGTRR